MDAIPGKLTEDQLPRLPLPKQHRQALAHLIRGLVRERDRGDLRRLNPVAFDEVRNAAGENSGLPRTRPRKDLERHLRWRGDG